MQRIKPAACRRKRLLCGILGQMLIPQSAAGNSHCQAIVTLVQFAKTIDVTRAGRFYKFRVRTLQWVSFSWAGGAFRVSFTQLVSQLEQSEREILKLCLSLGEKKF
jgi:hypothetical protein